MGTGHQSAPTLEVGQLVEAAQGAARGDTGPLLDRLIPSALIPSALIPSALIPSALTPGGAQPKVALSFAADFARVGPAEPPDDRFAAWLLKFDLDPELHAGRIERAFNLMAAAAGVRTAESRLLESRAGAVSGKTCDICRRDLLRLADDHGVRRGGAALDAVLDALARWPGFAAAAGLPPVIAAACRERMPGIG